MLDLIKTDTLATARELLGMKLLLDGENLGWIVETEAYLFPNDAASHSFQGRRSSKNESMYLEAGHWYVYQIYGHQMLNLVTRPVNIAEAVLIRALETPSGELLANGPGKLTRLASIDKSFDGQKLGKLTVVSDRIPLKISQRPRIGIEKVPELWKSRAYGFYVAGNPHVSKIKKSELLENYWK